jgi:Second Messenger Oligonucleotide or Dinucleotide Synthetase domain
LQLAGYLSELLASYNSRDHDTARERLDDAKTTLQEMIEGTLDQLFGGSVAKHTYVDGLSDIDSLLIVNGSKLGEQTPAAILSTMERVLRDSYNQDIRVEHGRMAVTISYPDGMTIQLLPAIRTETGLKVPSGRTEGWSHINPDTFTAALTRRNAECGGKLVPTIKLAKAVIANLPEQYRLTGYHVESLAIAAFRAYDGTKTTAIMLPHFFQQAKDLVLFPIRDSTGQSVHVDEYLGEANNMTRQYISRLLGNLAKRMRNASAAQSRAQWESLFDSE